MSLFQYSENKLSDSFLICQLEINVKNRTFQLFLQGINNTFLTVCQLSKDSNSGLVKLSFVMTSIIYSVNSRTH